MSPKATADLMKGLAAIKNANPGISHDAAMAAYLKKLEAYCSG